MFYDNSLSRFLEPGGLERHEFLVQAFRPRGFITLWSGDISLNKESVYIPRDKLGPKCPKL